MYLNASHLEVLNSMYNGRDLLVDNLDPRHRTAKLTVDGKPELTVEVDIFVFAYLEANALVRKNFSTPFSDRYGITEQGVDELEKRGLTTPKAIGNVPVEEELPSDPKSAIMGASAVVAKLGDIEGYIVTVHVPNALALTKLKVTLTKIREADDMFEPKQVTVDGWSSPAYNKLEKQLDKPPVPKGDYLHLCDYCGKEWYSSKPVKTNVWRHCCTDKKCHQKYVAERYRAKKLGLVTNVYDTALSRAKAKIKAKTKSR